MEILDIREMHPRERHEQIFRRADLLVPGDGLVIRTDHDPKPLFYQFEAERNGLYEWVNLKSGPELWEVKILRKQPVRHMETVASIVDRYPAAADLFNRLGIDYCCHGDAPFDEAVSAKGYSPGSIMEEIRALPAPADRLNYHLWSMTMLCDFIEMNHHAYVRNKLPELLDLSDKVLSAHGKEHRSLFLIKEKLRILAGELMAHLEKEEKDLFPAIRHAEKSGEWHMDEMLQNALRDEHEEAGLLMQEIRQLADNFAPPADACFSFLRFYDGLAEFEKDLYAHVYLENNVLFKKIEGTAGHKLTV